MMKLRAVYFIRLLRTISNVVNPLLLEADALSMLCLTISLMRSALSLPHTLPATSIRNHLRQLLPNRTSICCSPRSFWPRMNSFQAWRGSAINTVANRILLAMLASRRKLSLQWPRTSILRILRSLAPQIHPVLKHSWSGRPTSTWWAMNLRYSVCCQRPQTTALWKCSRSIWTKAPSSSTVSSYSASKNKRKCGVTTGTQNKILKLK